jgi:hypothetical protein
MRFRKLLLLLLLLLSVTAVGSLNADDDDHDDDDDHGFRGSSHEYEGDEELSEGLGSLALLGFVTLNGLYFYSMGFKRLPKPVRTAAPKWVTLPLKLKSHFRNVHYLGNPLVIGIAWAHGVTAEESNLLVWAGWGLMLLLAFSGIIMKLQRADQPGARVNRLIHTQHLLSIAMVLLLWLGHGFLD